MSFLDGLSALSTAATQGDAGYLAGQQKGLQEQQQNLMTLLELKRQQRLDEQNAELQAAQRQRLGAQSALDQARTGEVGEEKFGTPFSAADAQGPGLFTRGSKGTTQRIDGLSPFEKPPQMVPAGAGVLNPITGKYDVPVAAKPVAQPRDQMVPVTQADGTIKYLWANPVTHAVTEAPFQGTKPPASGAAGQTRLPERTQQFGLALHNATEALPAHEAMVGQNAPGLVAVVGGAASQAGGKEGAGANWALNKLGESQYLRYVDAMNGMLLAVAHSVGGARINKEQINMFAGNFMLRGGDPLATNAQKLRAQIDFINAARATLPPDAVAKQEALIPPDKMAYLRSKGYGQMPSPAGIAVVEQLRKLGGMTDDSATEGNVTGVVGGGRGGSGGRGQRQPAPTPSYEEWKKARGIP